MLENFIVIVILDLYLTFLSAFSNESTRVFLGYQSRSSRLDALLNDRVLSRKPVAKACLGTLEP